MIPCHGYPELKKYSHLVGNYGSAWQDQQKEFDNMPGCILMTTNCLMRPRESYKDRIFTASVVGCDGAIPGRNYYTEFAKHVPNDCIIFTLSCGKYRFNKLNFGEVACLPKLLDIWQCNDAYSAIKIATSLADVFDTDVNWLPLSIILSWYEQKVVADLLALLSLGVKGIFLGSSLPAFISQNVLQYLVDTFDIRPISTYEDDLKTCLQQ